MRHVMKSGGSSGLSTLPNDERQRLAVALHQSTAQALVALAVNLDLVQQHAAGLDPRARRMLEESRALATQCFDEVLGLVDALYPALVDEVGLPRDHRAARRSQ
jgi:signal transduction histidine kinase